MTPRIEILGGEVDGWAHSLGVDVDGGRLLFETYWRRDLANGTPTPVALGLAESVDLAAQIVRVLEVVVDETPGFDPDTARRILAAIGDVEQGLARLQQAAVRAATATTDEGEQQS